MKMQLEFGNDKSRLVRGLAIILMVCGHSFPGCVIPFAVPLFSFLVGYGYAFAKKQNLSHAFKRIWHLLKGFWWILFLICLPVGVFYTHYKFEWWQLVLNMFGLWGGFNFYCWYIYFYIFSMLIMPVFARISDRTGIAGVLAIWGAFALGDYAIAHYISAPLPLWLNALQRCIRYFPIVIVAYWWARNKVYSNIKFSKKGRALLAALLVCAGSYAVRYFPVVRNFDPVIAPVFAGAFALVLQLFAWRPLLMVLTELGMKSMNIWFLHALFFTHSTRGLFLPLVTWIPKEWALYKPLFIFTVLLCSYMMAVAIDYLQKTPYLLRDLIKKLKPEPIEAENF